MLSKQHGVISSPIKTKTQQYLISLLSIANVYFQMLIQIGFNEWASVTGKLESKMPLGPHKHTHTRKTAWTCVVKSISVSLDTWGSQQCTKKIGDSGMQYIYKRNGGGSHKSPLRPEISNVLPSRDVNLPHSLKPHRNSPQGLQREKTRIQWNNTRFTFSYWQFKGIKKWTLVENRI